MRASHAGIAGRCKRCCTAVQPLVVAEVGNALLLFDTGLLLALLQAVGAVAALFSHLARLPRWWLPIQAYSGPCCTPASIIRSWRHWRCLRCWV